MKERFAYGVDMGGTCIKFGFFSSVRGLLDRWEIPTDKSDHGIHIIDAIASEVNAHLQRPYVDRSSVIGIGVGVPGPVTGDRYVERAVNIGWEGVALSDILEKLVGLPVICLNDANAAAMGEVWVGGGQSFSSIVLLTLGTGLGGGIIIDGNILRGFHGVGGELGHVLVEAESDHRCNCGRFGCFEYYGSATGLLRLANEFLSQSALSSPLRLIKDMTAKDIWDLSKSGDKAAAEITDRYCRYIAKGAANIACVCDPQAFLIGGGVSEAGQPLLDGIRKHYREIAFPSCADTEFRLAVLGNNAGIYGCVHSVFSEAK